MKKIKAYRAKQVKNVCLDQELKDRDGQRVDVGFDVGKDEFFGVLRWGQTDFGRPWKVKNPVEIGD